MELQHRPLPNPFRRKRRKTRTPNVITRTPTSPDRGGEKARCYRGIPMRVKGRDAGGKPRAGKGQADKSPPLVPSKSQAYQPLGLTRNGGGEIEG